MVEAVHCSVDPNHSGLSYLQTETFRKGEP